LPSEPADLAGSFIFGKGGVELKYSGKVKPRRRRGE